MVMVLFCLNNFILFELNDGVPSVQFPTSVVLYDQLVILRVIHFQKRLMSQVKELEQQKREFLVSCLPGMKVPVRLGVGMSTRGWVFHHQECLLVLGDSVLGTNHFARKHHFRHHGFLGGRRVLTFVDEEIHRKSTKGVRCSQCSH